MKPPSEWRVLSLPSNPGLLLLPDLFQTGSQHYWVRRCLVDYPCRPNVCNLDAHLQRTGNGCLWLDDDLLLTGQGPAPPEPKRSRTSEPEMTSKPETMTPLTIAKDSPLYRLRWVTLGYHYDWSKKEYCCENRSPFPEDLEKLSSFIFHCVGFPRLVQHRIELN